jgi:hypothetical protein
MHTSVLLLVDVHRSHGCQHAEVAEQLHSMFSSVNNCSVLLLCVAAVVPCSLLLFKTRLLL